MKLLKISNLTNNLFRHPDYKGLDTTQFIAGSQLYAAEKTYCYLGTNQEDIESHPDLYEITEQEYIEFRNSIENDIVKPQKTLETKLEEQKEQLSQQNQLMSDFMDLVFSTVPELQS